MGATYTELTSKKRKGTEKRFGSDFQGFIDIPLSKDDTLQVQGHAENRTLDVGEFLEALMEEGYKFSLALDAKHSAYIATATGKNDGCKNIGYALSGRGPSTYGAIVCLWFKMAEMANWGVWTIVGSQTSNQLPLFG